MKSKFFTLFVLIFLGSNSLLQAQTDRIPVDPSVRMGMLKNGMQYYIKKNGTPENRVELRLAVNAGAMQEDDDQQGLAHFVEHMAFNGSKNFKKNELVDYLESVGTKFGPDLNAYTSFDETVYMIQTRTDDKDILYKGLLILEDWAGALDFDHEEIDKERGVVMSEWRSRLSPDQRMQQNYFPIMYKDSRYATRLPIGKTDVIQHADYETFKRFYRDWYRPDLMAIAIVGDIDVEEMEKEVIARFSQLKNPDKPRKIEEYPVPNHKETLISINSDKEASFSNVRLMYKHPRIETNTLEEYRASLVRNLYNRMLNARLDELSQSPEPPFNFAYSGYGRDVGKLDTYEGYAMTAEGGTLKGLEVLLTENKRALQHGFNESELERQKADMLNQAERAAKESDKTESRRLVMRYVYHFLDDNPIPSPEQTLELYQRYLPTITVEEINKLAKNWITEENRVIVITGPEKEATPMPTEADVLATLQKIEKMTVEPYVDNVSDAPLLTDKLTEKVIRGTQEMPEVGVTELILENGVKVILKPTDFKNDEVLMTAFSPGGHSLYPDEMYPSASNASNIINQSGIGEFDAVQLEKKLSGKTVSCRPYISELWEGMNGNASPDDLETLFQLIYLYFQHPRLDNNALQSYIAKQKGVYANLMSNPQYWFNNEMSNIKYNNHPRRGFPTAEQMDAIKMEEVMKVYQDRFADASDFTFVFVGNFDMDKMKTYAATYLGNLPKKDRIEKAKDVGADMVKGQVSKDLSKGEAPKSLVEMTFHGDFDWTPENRYHLNSLVQVMRIKMRESMREDKGGVYGVSVRSYATQFPKPSYNITVSFNSDPANTEDLIETALKDIENARMNGAEEKDLMKIKETQLQERIKDLRENRFWSNEIRNRSQNNEDLNAIQLKSLEEAIKGLTSEDIKQAANKFFDENNFIRVSMKPAEVQDIKP